MAAVIFYEFLFLCLSLCLFSALICNLNLLFSDWLSDIVHNFFWIVRGWLNTGLLFKDLLILKEVEIMQWRQLLTLKDHNCAQVIECLSMSSRRSLNVWLEIVSDRFKISDAINGGTNQVSLCGKVSLWIWSGDMEWFLFEEVHVTFPQHFKGEIANLWKISLETAWQAWTVNVWPIRSNWTSLQGVI